MFAPAWEEYKTKALWVFIISASQLKKMTSLRIEYADDIAQLPEAPEDIRALRFLFSKRFTDDDIRQSALKQPSKLYLRAFADTL